MQLNSFVGTRAYIMAARLSFADFTAKAMEDAICNSTPDSKCILPTDRVQQQSVCCEQALAHIC